MKRVIEETKKRNKDKKTAEDILDELKKEAQTIFKNTECAEDFMKVEVL